MPSATFLVTSVTLAAVAVTGILTIVARNADEAGKVIAVAEAMGLLLGQTLLTLIGATLVAKARRVRELAPDVLAAYSYTSWTFILIGAAIATAFSPNVNRQELIATVFVVAVPYNCYVLYSTAMAIGHTGRHAAVFVGIASMIVVTLTAISSALLPGCVHFLKCLQCDNGIVRSAQFVTFNSHPRDFAMLRVWAPPRTGWFSNTDVVDDGTVTFAIFVNNNGPTTAHDVRAHLFFDGFVKGTTTVRAVVTAKGVTHALEGTAVLRSTESVRCEYDHGHVQVGDEKEVRGLPFGQSGRELMTTGIQIGELKPGWDHAQSVLATFRCAK